MSPLIYIRPKHNFLTAVTTLHSLLLQLSFSFSHKSSLANQYPVGKNQLVLKWEERNLLFQIKCTDLLSFMLRKMTPTNQHFQMALYIISMIHYCLWFHNQFPLPLGDSGIANSGCPITGFNCDIWTLAIFWTDLVDATYKPLSVLLPTPQKVHRTYLPTSEITSDSLIVDDKAPISNIP